MLLQTYNTLTLFAFVCFILSLCFSFITNIIKRNPNQESFGSAAKIILMGISCVLFFMLATKAGDIQVFDTAATHSPSADPNPRYHKCEQCTFLEDSHMIFYFGMMSFLSFVLIAVFFIQNFFEAKTTRGYI